MGGSILGAQAVYDFFKTKIKKQIFFVNNLEASLLKEINTNCSKKNTLFILISKSGNTIETLRDKNLFIEVEKIKYPVEILSKPLNTKDFKNI